MNYLSPAAKKILNDFVTVIWAAFIIYLAYLSYQLMGKLMVINQLSPALQIPMWAAYSSVPVGCTLMVFRLLQQFIREIKSKDKGV